MRKSVRRGVPECDARGLPPKRLCNAVLERGPCQGLVAEDDVPRCHRLAVGERNDGPNPDRDIESRAGYAISRPERSTRALGSRGMRWIREVRIEGVVRIKRQ